MINLQGTLINAFRMEGGKGKDGKEYEARDKVQILGSLELPNGEIKHELVDLTVDARMYEPFKNKVISISCGAMAIGRNVVFYVRKGAKPVLAEICNVKKQ
jgi:hypothetical protein